uniref:Uncharacterized protein n=1 Tax=Tanacetum cinerariifolium TaxID=118510 RepID=A0A6L2NRJ2_TANCI|nr:hypothetical protein [Tanacetum cinerariifolium]
MRLQALIDRRKVIITEDTIRQALRLDDAAEVDCLSNEEIFAELARMGYEKPNAWNEFSSFIASAVICLAIGGCIQTGGKIAELDVDEDVTLEEVNVEVAMDADVQGRLAESQIKVYHLDLDHAEKVLSMYDTDEAEPAKVKEASAPRRRRGVIIQDPEETANASVIVHSEVKSKDKGKGILIKEPKPLKRQVQIKQDEAFVRELEAKLNANINWNDVMEYVKRKEKQDNTVMRYQALKRKPVTEAQARKNMMVYLKNMARFKMDFFKEGSKRKDASPEQRVAKKQRIDEEVKELKTHLQIVPNDDVYTEATPLALKVPVVDYQIHHEHNKPYYKIIRADGTHQLFLSFITLLKNFDREDLEMIYGLAKVKSWKLFGSCRVHILTLTTTQMILLVEKKYPLTRFTLEQMLNNLRLEVKEESEMSLELLRSQAIEITKLKQRVKRFEKKRHFKSSGLKRLRKVGTAQRIESSADTVMDDQEDASKQGEKIAELDADEDITLEEVDAEVTMDADVQGRLAESQAKVYHLDLDHAEKVLFTTGATTITAAQVPKASAPRRRRGVIIQDPEETATASVKRKEKQDNTVMRFQALKRKPVTEAHARKNMMVYLKNMAGFKMDFFKGMTYTDIRPIFEKHYNSIQAFLEKGEEENTEQKERSKEKMTVLSREHQRSRGLMKR